MKIFFVLLLLLAGCASTAPANIPVPAPTPYTPPTPKETLELSFHGGTVLHNAKTVAVFWGESWPGDQSDKIGGIQSLLQGLGGSDYIAVTNQYGDRPNSVGAGASYDRSIFDFSAAPSLQISDTNALGQEICKLTNFQPDINTIYLVYADTPPPIDGTTGKVSDCGWHSSFWCEWNGTKTTATMAYLPNLDAVENCSPDDTATTHSAGLAAVASVTAHEISESITNPYGNGWYDEEGTTLCVSGQQCEIGDKCAWTFQKDADDKDVLVTLSNQTQWKIQMEWSNVAYEAGTGTENLLNQRGCVNK